MENGIISALYFTGLNCRAPGIRSQVLELLSTPRREGLWDSRVISFIIERVIALEEGDMRVPSLSRPDSSDPKQSMITAEMFKGSLREVIETARNELRASGGYVWQMPNDAIGTEANSDSIGWEALVSFNLRPAVSPSNSDSPP
jgi:hypothetical protein